ANKANDDGGGIQLLRPLTYHIEITNNIIANNVAADIAGGIVLDDASDVVIANNSIAANASTSTAEDRDFSCGTQPISCPHAAGLVSTTNSSPFQFILDASGPGAPNFSNPVLFGNIFWQNEAFFYNPNGGPPDSGLPPNLPSAGFIDMEVFAPDTPATELLHPKFSILTVAYAGADATNIVGVDPLFVAQEETDPVAVPFRLNPNEIIIEFLRITNLSGDYHLQPTSPAIDRITVANLVASGITAPTLAFDFDSQIRPFPGTDIDIGADEFGGSGPPPPPPVIALLYFSTLGDAAIPGVAGPYDDADIYKYDSAGNYSRIFDASAVGLAATANIDALYMPDPNTIYMSFSTDAGTTVPGVGVVQDEDIVRYNAAANTWTLYFDGSDVGMGGANGPGVTGEDVDAFAILPNGDVIVSPLGSANVTGLAGTFVSQDLLLCSGGTRGDITNCTWSQYFDGSDVGLTVASENIDDVTIYGSNILLSTTGNFSVAGLSGQMVDVFVCQSATVGVNTACGGFSLYFDGSAHGITNTAINNIDAFQSTQDPATIVTAAARTSTARTPTLTAASAGNH
ncbi:MAG: hypothetical protein ACREFM_18345, partial [Hypericibacter sp.]